VDPHYQLQPGISPDGCDSSGVATNGGWTQPALAEYLDSLDDKGVRHLTVWTSDAFLLPATVSTCPWFMPMLRNWTATPARGGARDSDQASGGGQWCKVSVCCPWLLHDSMFASITLRTFTRSQARTQMLPPPTRAHSFGDAPSLLPNERPDGAAKPPGQTHRRVDGHLGRGSRPADGAHSLSEQKQKEG
jgi:hypothetical protein